MKDGFGAAVLLRMKPNYCVARCEGADRDEAAATKAFRIRARCDVAEAWMVRPPIGTTDAPSPTSVRAAACGAARWNVSDHPGVVARS
ncbi:hypothetical protein ACI2IY_15235 [Lysobacter enzymogenes]|uniref:hypothetical protein n=1 Tax=Lysobacter enzymogenes TaxID=69 RepID=UPI00384B7B3F